MTDKAKNEYQHNDDGTTYIFIESKNRQFPGKHTIIIDTEYWDMVKGCSWHIKGSEEDHYPYVETKIPHPDGGWYTRPNGKRERRRIKLRLHHLILGKPEKGLMIDHKNHNGLDNRKDNLRILTNQQNQFNRRSNKNSSSKYKGVGWIKSNNKWRAKIQHNKKSIHIGSFTCEKEAARAVNNKARELGLEEHFYFNEVEDE